MWATVEYLTWRHMGRGTEDKGDDVIALVTVDHELTRILLAVLTITVLYCTVMVNCFVVCALTECASNYGYFLAICLTMSKLFLIKLQKISRKQIVVMF